MALHVAFSYQTGFTLDYSVQQIGTALWYDFSSASFSATPTTQYSSLPEVTPPGGEYATTIASTPATTWTNGSYLIRISNHAAADLVVGLAEAVMYNGDDAPYFGGGSGGTDPLTELVPGSYGAGTAGVAIGEIPGIATAVETSIPATLSSISAQIAALTPTSSPVQPVAVVVQEGGQVLRQAIGVDGVYTLTLYDGLGNLVTSFQGTDTLSAVLWGGYEQPVSLAPSVVWLSPSAGTVTLTLSAAQTLTLTPAVYRLRVTVAPLGTGQTLDLWDGSIELLASPESATPATPTYCAIEDMRLYAPWIDKLMASDDTSGFISQRGRARTWYDDLIARHYRYSGGLSRQQNLLMGGSGRNGYRTGMRPVWLMQYLAANALMLWDEVREANARYAIGLVCDAQVGIDNPYRARAREFFERADRVASETTVQLDINNDGFPDIIIDLGVADTLQG